MVCEDPLGYKLNVYYVVCMLPETKGKLNNIDSVSLKNSQYVNCGFPNINFNLKYTVLKYDLP